MFCLVVGDAVDGTPDLLHDILVCPRLCEFDLAESIGIVRCILRDGYGGLLRHRGVTDFFDREGKAVRVIPRAAGQVFQDPDLAFAGSGVGIRNGDSLHQLTAGIRYQVSVSVIDYDDRHKMFCLVVGDSVDGAPDFLHDIFVCTRRCEFDLTEGVGIVRCILRDRYGGLLRHRGVTDFLDREGKAVRVIP